MFISTGYFFLAAGVCGASAVTYNVYFKNGGSDGNYMPGDPAASCEDDTNACASVATAQDFNIDASIRDTVNVYFNYYEI